jgi:hypothetical protein
MMNSQAIAAFSRTGFTAMALPSLNEHDLVPFTTPPVPKWSRRRITRQG